MVRFCIVPECKSNDSEILCHRFPRNSELKQEWKKSLGINDSDDHIDKYVVCTKHFDINDYRHAQSRFLNWTACPKLNPVNSRYYQKDIELIASPISSPSSSLSNQNNKRKYYGIENFNIIEQKKKRSEYKEEYETENETEITLIENITEKEQNDENDLDQKKITYLVQIQDNDEDVIVINEPIKSDVKFDNVEINENINYDLIEYDDIFEETETKDNDKRTILKNFREIGCQTNVIDDEIQEISDDDEYNNFTKSQLINLVKESKNKIVQLENKILKIENAHSKLMDCLKTFQLSL